MKQLRRGYMRKVDRTAYIDSMREIDIHKILCHPNIIRLHEIIDDDDDDKVYLIMEYAELGQILTHDPTTNLFVPPLSLGTSFLSEKDVRKYAQQIVEAVAYLHQKKVMHCDLKPQNILIDSSGNAKLADFGSAQIYY